MLRYGNAYELPSPRAEELNALIAGVCGAHGILHRPEACFEYLRAFPEKFEQLSLFDTGL